MSHDVPVSGTETRLGRLDSAEIRLRASVVSAQGQDLSYLNT